MGTVVKPLENAEITVDLPSWISPNDVFEITYEGTRDISWKHDGAKISLDLGTVNVSRFVLISSDAALRRQLQKRYETQFAANVAKLVAGKDE